MGRRFLAIALAVALSSGGLCLVWALPGSPGPAPAEAATTGGPCGGCVFAWGMNDVHQADVPASVARGGAVAISARGKLAMALTWDGKVVVWGDNHWGQANIPSHLGRATAIASGGDYAAVILTTGAVRAWGNPNLGVTTIPAAAQSNVLRIAAARDCIIAEKQDGTLVAWGLCAEGRGTFPWVVVKSGLGSFSMLKPISGLKEISGYTAVLGIAPDNTAVAWGSNSKGQATVSPLAGTVKAVAAGYDFGLAITTSGKVVGWGNSASGQIAAPSGTGFTHIAAGDRHALAIRDGMLVPWGNNSHGQLTLATGILAGGNVFRAVAAGSDLSVALYDKPSPPLPPFEVIASAGDASALVSWPTPADYGAPITGYKVVSKPGGKTCQTTGAETCTVTGLTNGVTYTFTVTATNGIGTGVPSGPSNAVTPMAGLVPKSLILTPKPSAASGSQGAAPSGTGTSASPAASSGESAGVPSSSPAASSSKGSAASTPSPQGGRGSGGSGSDSPILPLAVAAVVGTAAVAAGAVGLYLRFGRV